MRADGAGSALAATGRFRAPWEAPVLRPLDIMATAGPGPPPPKNPLDHETILGDSIHYGPS